MVENKAVNKTVASVNPVEEVLTRLIGNTKDGELSVDAIQKELPNYGYSELLKALRETKKGELVVGRRGHKSRFVWGDQPVRKTPVLNRNPRKNHTTELEGNRQLCVKIGDARVFIPVSLELVDAAA